MNLTFRPLGPSELLPRYLFAESLFARRRVLEVGAVASTAGASAKFLSERGARWVVACDESLEAVENAQRTFGSAQLRFRTAVFDDLESNSFDLVLVADLAPYVRAPQLLKDLVRLVSSQGYLVGGLRNIAGVALAQLREPESVDVPPTFGQLLDLLQPHFPSVEVATQSPILGYQLAFQSADGLQVDGSLAGTGESAYWVVFAGHQPVAGLDPTWVQLPPEPLAYTGGRLDEFSKRSRAWEERCSKLKDLLSQTRAELQEGITQGDFLRRELEKARTDSARLTAQLESVRSQGEYARDRDELALRVRRMEAEIQAAQQRANEAEGRIAHHQAEVAAGVEARKDLESELLAAQEALRLERARRDEQVSVVEEARTRLAKAQEKLRGAEDEAAAAREEREQASLERDRAVDSSRRLERELSFSREREVRLAEQHSASISEIEDLRNEAGDARREARAAAASLEGKEAELASALRAAQADSELIANAKALIEGERTEIQRTLHSKDQQIATLETNLISAQSTAERALAELDRSRSTEGSLRSLSEALEQKLGLEREENAKLSSRMTELEAQLEADRARAQRLERDVETAVAAQRSSRDQAEERAAARIAEFESVIEDFNRARTEDARALEQLTAQYRQLTQERDQAAAEVAREREAWASEREAQAERHDQLGAAMDALRAQHASELDSLQAQRASDIESEQARTIRASQLKDRAIFRAEKAEQRLADLEGRLTQSTSELQAKESSIASLESSLKEALAVRGEADAAQQQLRDELDLLRQAHQQKERERETTLVERDSQVGELRSLVEGYESEIRGITEERDRMARELERLERSRSELQSQVDAHRAELDRLQERSSEEPRAAAIAERDAKLELFQRRLNAQETELSVLRRALGRAPAAPVQQIFERASAEISAVKADLRKRNSLSGASAEATSPVVPRVSATLDAASEEATLPGGSSDKPK